MKVVDNMVVRIIKVRMEIFEKTFITTVVNILL